MLKFKNKLCCIFTTLAVFARRPNRDENFAALVLQDLLPPKGLIERLLHPVIRLAACLRI